MLLYRFFILGNVSKDSLNYLKGALNRWQQANGGIITREGDFTYIVCGCGETEKPALILNAILSNYDFLAWEKLALSERYAYEHARQIAFAKMVTIKKQKQAKTA